MMRSDSSRLQVAWRAGLVLAIVASAPAQADVVFDNFDVGGGFHSANYSLAVRVPHAVNGPANRSAAQFTVSGGSFTLDSITLPVAMDRTIPTTNVVRIRLTEDAGGTPGTTLEVLSENQDVWPPYSDPMTTTTFPSTSNPPLLEGSSYWIVTEGTIHPTMASTVRVDWYFNTSGSTVPFRHQQVTGALPTDPWSGFSGPQPMAFRVVGTPSVTSAPTITEPSSALVVTRLEPPFPNPFVDRTTLRFELLRPTPTRVAVVDVLGRTVKTLATWGTAPAGTHSVGWDGRDAGGRLVASGVYFLYVESASDRQTRRVQVLR